MQQVILYSKHPHHPCFENYQLCPHASRADGQRGASPGQTVVLVSSIALLYCSALSLLFSCSFLLSAVPCAATSPTLTGRFPVHGAQGTSKAVISPVGCYLVHGTARSSRSRYAGVAANRSDSTYDLCSGLEYILMCARGVRRLACCSAPGPSPLVG
jgi:hypothetical protein